MHSRASRASRSARQVVGTPLALRPGKLRNGARHTMNEGNSGVPTPNPSHYYYAWNEIRRVSSKKLRSSKEALKTDVRDIMGVWRIRCLPCLEPVPQPVGEGVEVNCGFAGVY